MYLFHRPVTMGARLRSFLYICGALMLFLSSGIVWGQGQEPIFIGAGGKTGSSYTRFIDEASTVCKDKVSVATKHSGGSLNNLEMINDNFVNGAIVQLDALALYGKAMDLSGLKVLLPVFPEQLHFITRANLNKKTGGVMGIGAKPVVLNSLADLAGYDMVAAGGSWVTLQLVKQMGLPATIKEFRGSSADVVKLVLNGTHDSALLVGAAPLGAIADLPPETQAQLKLLTIPQEMLTSFQKFYKDPGAVAYRQTANGPSPVSTVSVMSAIVTQNYPTGPVADKMLAFRDCIIGSAGLMSARVGTHPAWRNIRPNQATSWPKYEVQYSNK